MCEMGSDVTLGRQFLKSNNFLVDFGRAKLLLRGNELDFVDHNGLKIEQKIISCNTGVTENNRKSLNLNIANSASVELLSDKGRSGGDVNSILMKSQSNTNSNRATDAHIIKPHKGIAMNQPEQNRMLYYSSTS